MGKRTPIIYGVLVGIWVLLTAWQVTEHRRVESSLRQTLAHRAKDISTSLGIVLRAQRGFGGFVPASRLQSSLDELMTSDELITIALLNRAMEPVTVGGVSNRVALISVSKHGEKWGTGSAFFVNRIDLGVSSYSTNNRPREAIVMEPRTEASERERERERERQRSPEERRKFLERWRKSLDSQIESIDNSTNNAPGTNSLVSTNNRARRPTFFFRRPSGMTEDEFEELREKRGVYGTLIQMNTVPIQEAVNQDKRLRTFVAGFGLVALLAVGFGWRTVSKTQEFEMRLVRAREQNAHLKEMNMAAAGLAHETRNPLNLIRGIAQMISKEDQSSPSIKENCLEITDEVDRVTGQLNEFINYSRPREVRRTPMELGQMIDDVLRPLRGELEDQNVTLKWKRHDLQVEADEKMLRQVLFNLLLNSLQAIDKGGTIEIVTGKNNGHGAFVEVRDDGPGVAQADQEKIFQPYFTTHEKGTGLGLSIVRQIVLAHGWDVQYRANQPRGAVFRIGQMTVPGQS